MTSTPNARDAIAALQGHEAWAIIRRSTRAGDRDSVGLVGGKRSVVESLLDVPLEEGVPEAGHIADRLLAVPFRQVAERGFEAHDDGTPLVVVDVETELEFSVAEVVEAIDEVEVTFADRGGFETDDEEYGRLVEAIIRDEIGQGEGANLVVGRHYRAKVDAWGAEAALAVFRRLLERERGAYWTFLFFTGDRYLIGASPERHVSIHGGDVRMNPISGTFRIPREPDADVKGGLLEFLRDEKEIYELFMVVDEELKMMCDICNQGGQVLGPFLKPMSRLVHTEYLLAGRTDRDPREVLRDTMYAATVTGSPVENACRLIKAYETEGRGYYGAALAVLGRDPEGGPVVDSPIVIRTADVDLDGNLKVTAGATLVRDSDAAYEVAETHAKAGGILSAFGLVPAAPTPDVNVAELVNDEDVLLALNARNRRLSSFWLTDQGGSAPDPRLAGRSAVILDGEDDFVNMLRHVLGVLGMTSTVVRHEEYVAGCLDGFDLVIVGPGPGDPRDDADPKMANLRAAVAELLAKERPFLAVCLGHQALCHELGIPLAYKDIVFQGTQSPVTLEGRTERVGFYNTFVGRVGDGDALPEGVRVDTDPATGDVHHLAGPHYRGIQFHAESILTERGYDLLHDYVVALLLDRPGDA
ncbi:anthranilate synthase family protein [Nocardioides marmotae]|uniref:anthranilate synthase n=1 Tax=Nocardioides marmotae TaxID=2663857 RepID=A0A6I3JEW8_9ACTN|nr:anthranilate synthase family protein [Nocardioides marmotae]MCR6033048.1 phenazine-specific anthranilate synthase component I [Gordonia jinghuaiqii]MBC9732547.1 phenazine-specific anthranilate synthase [Nocardioides marmotae]MTB83666.1 phenazine-specific anthranilate synthase component I [Nocardioides marmotae]MTB96700.1 phenazine-specific anthranilate synthase component I [Nocardioides marmotae]QKE03086.1 phenazine-specific anthranilate synthase [Nocardioides marmotae]